jgi:hypothetical protein
LLFAVVALAIMAIVGAVAIAYLWERLSSQTAAAPATQSAPGAVSQSTPQSPVLVNAQQQPVDRSPAPSGLGGTPPKGIAPFKVGDLVFSFPESCHIEASDVVCIGTLEDLGDPGEFAFRNDTTDRGLAYLGGKNMAFTDAFFLPHSFVATLNPAKPMWFRIAFPDNGEGATTTDLVVSLNWRNGNDRGVTIPSIPINR